MSVPFPKKEGRKYTSKHTKYTIAGAILVFLSILGEIFLALNGQLVPAAAAPPATLSVHVGETLEQLHTVLGEPVQNGTSFLYQIDPDSDKNWRYMAVVLAKDSKNRSVLLQRSVWSAESQLTVKDCETLLPTDSKEVGRAYAHSEPVLAVAYQSESLATLFPDIVFADTNKKPVKAGSLDLLYRYEDTTHTRLLACAARIGKYVAS